MISLIIAAVQVQQNLETRQTLDVHAKFPSQLCFEPSPLYTVPLIVSYNTLFPLFTESTHETLDY